MLKHMPLCDAKRLLTIQGWLWIDPKEDIKKRRLMDAVDEITNTYGRHSLTLAKS